MELVVTLIFLLIFILGVLVIDLQIKLIKVDKKLEILINIFKLKTEMNNLKSRLQKLGGGAPDQPEPSGDDDD